LYSSGDRPTFGGSQRRSPLVASTSYLNKSLKITKELVMRFSTRRTRFSKRRSRRRTLFPLVAVVQKKAKPQYTSSRSIGEQGKRDLQPIRAVKRSRGTIDYKNVVLLRKLITSEGKILPRRINKLTAKQQRYTAKAIKSARIMGLLPFINKTRSIGS